MGTQSIVFRCAMLVALFLGVTVAQYANQRGPFDTSSSGMQLGCNTTLAKDCELQLLSCRLFSGPANDEATMCRCGEDFFGKCLRNAGCEMHEEVNPPGQLYFDKCVDHIMRYDCNPPDALMCAVNCASPGTIDVDKSMIVIFNNYGEYYLRIRICKNIVHPLRFDNYSIVDPIPCNEDTFKTCGRWIPPQTFTPVALPSETTYIEIDSCLITPEGTQLCIDSEKPVRVYGNSQLFPEKYDVPKGPASVCSSDADCMGSFCEKKLRPSTCAPKLRRHLLYSGKKYFEVD